MRGQPNLMMKIRIGRAMAPMIRIVSRLTAPRSSRWTFASSLRNAVSVGMGVTLLFEETRLHERPANQGACHLIHRPDDLRRIIVRHRHHRQGGSQHEDVIEKRRTVPA